jgi:hypothetical protein
MPDTVFPLDGNAASAKKIAPQSRLAVPLQPVALLKTHHTPRHSSKTQVDTPEVTLSIGFGSHSP